MNPLRLRLIFFLFVGISANLRAAVDWVPVSLTPSLVMEALDPALMCLAAYSDNRVAGWQGPALEMSGLPLDDQKSGFHACFYTRFKDGIHEIALAFRGTDMPSEADWKTNYLQVILGQLPEQYLRARSFAQELKALAKASERRGELTRTILTGHSLGGGLAEFSGVFWSIRSICFASSPMGKLARKTCVENGLSGIDQAASFITHIFLDGDFVPDLSKFIGTHLGRVVSPALKPPSNFSGVDADKKRGRALLLAGLIFDVEKASRRTANVSTVVDLLARHSISNYIEALVREAGLPSTTISLAGAWQSRGSFFQVSSRETTFFLCLNGTLILRNEFAMLGESTRTIDHGFWDFDGRTLRIALKGLATLHYQLRGAISDQGLSWHRTRVIPDEAGIQQNLGERGGGQNATLLLFRAACAMMENRDVAWTRGPDEIFLNPAK